MITIKIPVKKYVRKYLIREYGCFFMVARKDHVGLMLWMLLKKGFQDKSYESMTKQYTETYEVKASENMIYKKGVRYLSDYATVQFNIFIEHLIHDELHKFVDNELSNGVQQVDAIRNFITKYDLVDTELDYQNLRKSCQRYRKKKEMLNKHAPILSPL
jgi:hypothetical protein